MRRYRFLLFLVLVGLCCVAVVISCNVDSDINGSYEDVVPSDVTGPKLLDISPEPGDTWVSVLAPIVAQFNEDIDPSSVTRESFQITPEVYAARQTCRTEVACTVWSKMQWNTTYNVVLTTSLTDTFGNKIPQEVSWSFTTRVRPPAPVITGFSSPSGVINSPLTIYGTGFDSVRYENHIWFGPDTSIVISSNDTMIQTIVPPNAKTSRIIVENQTDVDTSEEVFSVLPPAPNLSGSYRGTFRQIDQFNTISPDTSLYYVKFQFYPTVFVMFLDTDYQPPTADAPCDVAGAYFPQGNGIILDIDSWNWTHRDCDTTFNPQGFYGATKFGSDIIMVEYSPYYRRVKEFRITPY